MNIFMHVIDNDFKKFTFHFGSLSNLIKINFRKRLRFKNSYEIKFTLMISLTWFLIL